MQLELEVESLVKFIKLSKKGLSHLLRLHIVFCLVFQLTWPILLSTSGLVIGTADRLKHSIPKLGFKNKGEQWQVKCFPWYDVGQNNKWTQALCLVYDWEGDSERLRASKIWEMFAHHISTNNYKNIMLKLSFSIQSVRPENKRINSIYTCHWITNYIKSQINDDFW